MSTMTYVREIDPKISAEDIKNYFRQHRGPYISIFETGINGLRFDLIRITPWKRYIQIFEFKSGRADFKKDKKWPSYLMYCHTLTFVCPLDAINSEEIPKGIGLMYIWKWRWPDATRWNYDSKWMRKPRKRDVSTAILTDLAFTLLYRVIWRKEDIF